MLVRRQLGVGTGMVGAAVTRRPHMVIIISPAIFTVLTMRHDLLTAAPIVQHCGVGVRGAGGPGGGVGGAGATAGDGGSKEPAFRHAARSSRNPECVSLSSCVRAQRLLRTARGIRDLRV